MGLSNYLPSSRLIQPGVCTSTTRPASPFNGQVIYETDTKQTLVWQGSSWVMLTNADAPPGLELVRVQTIGTGVSSVTVSNVFSSTYDDYFLKFTSGTTSVSTNFLIQFGSTTTEYYGSYYYDLYTGGNTGTARRSNGANLYIGTAAGIFEGRQSTTFTIASPYLAQRTTIHGFNYGAGFSGWFGGEQYSTTSFTSFTIKTDSGTTTGGTVTVYGYRKA